MRISKTMVRRCLLRSIAAALALSALMAGAAHAAPARPADAPNATADGGLRLAQEVPGNLVAVHSGRCLDVVGGPAATGNGVPVQQYDCLGGAHTNQIWSLQNEIFADGRYYYNIVAQHSGKCLDVTGGPGATGNGVPLQQYDCLGSGATNQQWRLVVLKVQVQFVARHSGRCLDVVGGPDATGNGVPLQQYDCLGIAQANQLWYRY